MIEDAKALRQQKMMNMPIPRLVVSMAVPIILSSLINAIYSLVDTYFVSALGTNATAAVGVNTSLDQLIVMVGSMLAVGANSYIARLLGEKKTDFASTVLSTAFFLALGFGVVILLAGSVWMVPLVRLLGATETCERYAIQYATYVLLAAPVMAANFVMNQCLRAEGSAVRAMVGMGVGAVLNCFLDPIFIFKLNLGVAGASMATAISKVVSFCILLYPYAAGRSFLRIGLRRISISWSVLKEVLVIGSSSLLRNGFAVVASIVLNHIAGGISDAVLAGIGVANKVMMIPTTIFLGFGAGFQPVVGFQWGAEQFDRVRESYRFAAKLAVGTGLLMGVLLAVFAKPVIGFFSETDPEMLRIGALCIRLQCFAMPIHAWVAVVNMFCAGIGYGRGAVLLAAARQGTCLLPIAWPLAWLFGAVGAASVQAAADLLSLLQAIPVLKTVNKKIPQITDR